MTQIITSLHQHVTPEVLAQNATLPGDDASKKNALTSLYTVLAASLAYDKNESRFSTLDATNGDLLLGTLTADDIATPNTQGLYDAIATQENLPVATVTGLANDALPKAYAHIKSTAGTKTFPAYLASERDGLIGTLPAGVLPLLPAGLIAVGAPVARPDNGVLVKEEKEGGSAMKALLPIIGALILAGLAWALLKGCQKEPTPVATPVTTTTETVAPMTMAPATLAVALNNTGDAIFACDSDVGNMALGEQIRAAMNGIFPADTCRFDVSSTVANDMPALQYVPQILQFMKGVPDATVSIVGTDVLLNASDPAALETLIANVKGALPANFNVAAEPVLVEADVIVASNAAAAAALAALTDQSTIDELVHALNLQVINFAVDSAEIPDENKAILDTAAERLKMLPDAHLKITGHTDNTASHAYNKELSERRAQAVHDYLVSKGVSDEKLDTFGASFDEPVASNATEQGRFRNRRIEFTLLNDGVKITNVAGATDTTATATVTDATTNVGEAVVDGAATAGQAVVDGAATTADTVTDVAADAANTVQNAVTTN